MHAISASASMSVGAAKFAHMTNTPDVITRYYDASAAGDLEALIGCFTIDAHVRDEGHDFQGVAEIRSWRANLASRFTYTTEITGAEKTGDGEYLVSTHLAGDFPGGVVDLDQRFTLVGELIADLSI